MKKGLYKKGLVFGIIFLFLGLAVQPITSVDIEQYENSNQVEKLNTLNEDEAKEYLFETIIQIANNPDVAVLLKKYDQIITISDFDQKDMFKNVLTKNPRLYLSLLFTKPSFTYSYLNSAYKNGNKLIEILGENKFFDMLNSVEITTPNILDELKCVLDTDEDLSHRVETLAKMNKDIKLDSPFEEYPIICAILFMLTISLTFSWCIYVLIINNFSERNPILYSILCFIGAKWNILIFICIALLFGLNCIIYPYNL